MRTLLILLSSLFIATAAVADSAEPWVISGQTNIAAGTSIDNPTPANSGAVGAVASLPYVVPTGKRVCINAYGMEGYDASGIAVLFMWTGNPPVVTGQWRIDHGLPSVAADGGSQEITGMNFCFDEGTYLNVRLINGSTYGGVYGWYVTGTIADMPVE